MREAAGPVRDDVPDSAALRAHGPRYDAFLSYAREDGPFVDRLHAGLTAAQLRAWRDVEDILPGAQWRDRIRRGIEACRAFVLVVSPASLASEACHQELEEAIALNKLVIPVIRQDVADGDLSSTISRAEWVFLREDDDFGRGMERLAEALRTDLEWRDRAHADHLASASLDETIRLWNNGSFPGYRDMLCRTIDRQRAPEQWREAEPDIPFPGIC